MTIERDHRGAYIISDIICDYLVTRTYMGYTRKEAVSRFRAERRELKGKS